jgi:hypothetical protein
MAANYAALVAAWNGATQPPTGYVGTPINGGMTTAQKVAAVNSWTITGAIPTSVSVTGAAILNCIVWSEFAVLTAQQQSNLLMLLTNDGLLLGGSSNTGLITDGMLLAYFNVAGQTIANLTALAKGIVQTWWQVNGYSGPFNLNDAAAAGVS